MKKEVIVVPKDKCPLDVILGMEERIKDSWVFLHNTAISKLKTTANHVEDSPRHQVFIWYNDHEQPETGLTTSKDPGGEIWHKLYRISHMDIPSVHNPEDPKDIYFIQMAE